MQKARMKQVKLQNNSRKWKKSRKKFTPQIQKRKKGTAAPILQIIHANRQTDEADDISSTSKDKNPDIPAKRKENQNSRSTKSRTEKTTEQATYLNHFGKENGNWERCT
ncbi:hypothetical protein JTB14_025702 [Gonioctena quinquepunctata]|nr:hypothetical protein JTB14_025702 [Gonioctena quinquepunctata]